jgi:hypothetical protein
MQKPPNIFTSKFDQIARQLSSPVWIARAFDPSIIPAATPEKVSAKECKAIWDTGATGCVIGERVISECNLKPIGIIEVYTADGKYDAYKYFISLFLPNRIFMPQVPVTGGKLKDADMLIGMDIINRGDFAITNLGGKTTMSFRWPSCECIDFLDRGQGAKIGTLGIPAAKVGRNDPCPCGSGKKYKKCCGAK